MPIYEYRCPNCRHEQENFLRMREEKPVCEECGNQGLQRRLSLFAVSHAGKESDHLTCASPQGAPCAAEDSSCLCRS